MTGAVQAAAPAAPAAAGNATLLSAQPDPAPDTTPPTPVTPPAEPPAEAPAEPGPEADPAEPEKEDEGDAEPEGAPESYDFTAPEGVALDAAAVEIFTPIAKDLKLSQAQAQKLVDAYAGIQAQQAEAHAAQVKRWEAEVAADKDIGGRHMRENVEAAVAVLKRFGTPELNELLTSTGLGNHKELVRFCARVGKHFTDDTHVIGGAPTQPVDFATGFYGKMPKLEGVR